MGSNKLTTIDETECSSSSQSPENSLLQPSPTKPTITKTHSNKGKLMLIVNGYNFQFKNFNRKKTVKFWRCTNRSCNVILHTNPDDTFVKFSGTITDHNHLPNPADLELRDLKRSMKTRATTELVPLKHIAEQEMRKALLTGEALAVLPGANDIGHTLKHHRRKMTPTIPKSSSFFIPDLYKQNYNNKERLLLHDSDDSTLELNELGSVRPAGRVLVWASDVQLKLLLDSERLYMDGTFTTSPPHFDQVFIIMSILHGTCVPVVYALLPDRKAITYIYLFNVLFASAKQFNKKLDPQLIMTDFEPAVEKAIRLEFTEKTTQKGYNMMIRSAIRQMMALALVPEEYVPLLFSNLGQELDESERNELAGLLKYFDDYWMCRIPMWNCFKIPERTNNFCEGYNNRFTTRLNKKHPNIWVFIDAIQKEVHTVHNLIFQINSGMKPRAKRPKSKIVEQRMKELYERFDNKQIDPQQLLKQLSFFVANGK
ncbi:unnamed protein product [Rotaria socialis]|uniref:MULE transposase domain-containing protein n=1 Tax=Rotaria socialis TaxID=392032 RepID=A0A821IVC3_9BILA|nr:unnamed protein product [Rotaria socialis]CAF4500366.1 unnamed protein product [Rotaria socialis]CAF4707743.1 unnamed protein product [Rotaria socialis]